MALRLFFRSDLKKASTGLQSLVGKALFAEQMHRMKLKHTATYHYDGPKACLHPSKAFHKS